MGVIHLFFLSKQRRMIFSTSGKGREIFYRKIQDVYDITADPEHRLRELAKT
jgi:hypothetical protein